MPEQLLSMLAENRLGVDVLSECGVFTALSETLQAEFVRDA